MCFFPIVVKGWQLCTFPHIICTGPFIITILDVLRDFGFFQTKYLSRFSSYFIFLTYWLQSACSFDTAQEVLCREHCFYIMYIGTMKDIAWEIKWAWIIFMSLFKTKKQVNQLFFNILNYLLMCLKSHRICTIKRHLVWPSEHVMYMLMMRDETTCSCQI